MTTSIAERSRSTSATRGQSSASTWVRRSEPTHLRHQMTFSGTLALTSEIGEVRSFFGEGTGSQQQLDMERLSSIVDVLNDRFGTDLTDVDKLLLDQFEESWVADGELSDLARNNTSTTSALSSTGSFFRPSSCASMPTTRSTSRSSTTKTFARPSASSTCARCMSGCARQLPTDGQTDTAIDGSCPVRRWPTLRAGDRLLSRTSVAYEHLFIALSLTLGQWCAQ